MIYHFQFSIFPRIFRLHLRHIQPDVSLMIQILRSRWHSIFISTLNWNCCGWYTFASWKRFLGQIDSIYKQIMNIRERCLVNCKKIDFACTSTAQSSYTKHWKHTLQRFFLFLLTAYPCTEQLTSPKRDSESSHLVGKFWVYEIVNLISELFIWLRELGKIHEYF